MEEPEIGNSHPSPALPGQEADEALIASVDPSREGQSEIVSLASSSVQTFDGVTRSVNFKSPSPAGPGRVDGVDLADRSHILGVGGGGNSPLSYVQGKSTQPNGLTLLAPAGPGRGSKPGQCGKPRTPASTRKGNNKKTGML